MVNSSWDEAAQEIVVKDYVNLGIAAATPRGLVVPNIKDAGRLSLAELAGALGELTATAREGKTSPADMTGGTITITNVGRVRRRHRHADPQPRGVGDPGLRRGPRDAVGAQGQDRGAAGDAAGALLRPPDHRRRAGLPVPGRRRCAAARPGERRWRSEGRGPPVVEVRDGSTGCSTSPPAPGCPTAASATSATTAGCCAGRPVETWIVARMTHVFGLAQLLGRPGADELVRHGVARADRRAAARRRARRLAREHGRRHEGGLRARLRRPRRRRRRRRPGRRAARRCCDEALAVWQPGSGTTTPGWRSRSGTARWSRLTDYRGVNANMHGVEATLAAADALAADDPATAGRLRAQALRSTERVVHGWARERGLAAARALHRRVGAAARVQPGPAGRPVPALRRHRRAPVRVGAAGPAPAGGSTRRPARAGCSTTPSRCSTPRRRAAGRPTGTRLPVHAGLGRPAGRRRPHALGALRGGRRGDRAGRGHRREPRTADLAARVAGPRRGALRRPGHRQLAPRADARPARSARGTWAGQPDAYHLAQMLLLDGRPVRGSVAAALR